MANDQDKLKVLHICDKFGVDASSIHGVSRLFTWWMPRYDTSRFEVKLIGLRPADGASQNIESLGIPIISLGKSKFDATTLTALCSLIKKEEADVIHLHGYGSSTFGILAAKLTRTKCIVQEHFADPNLPVYQKVVDFFLSRHCDLGIAVSKSVKNFMVDERYFDRDNIEMMYSGAPLNEFKPLAIDQIVFEKAKWNLPEDAVTMITVGRLAEQKGHEYLIDALKLVQREFDNFRLLIVGDGPLLEPLKVQVAENGLQDHVIFTGHQSDVRTVLSIADIKVFSSIFEGTPLTLFEAMAAGKAIVSTDVDGLGEILKHDETALLCKSADVEGLANSLLAVCTDNELRQRLSRNAAEAGKEFDVENVVHRLQECYLRLASPKSI